MTDTAKNPPTPLPMKIFESAPVSGTAKETFAMFCRQTGEIYVPKCSRCGHPIYRFCLFGFDWLHCSNCKMSKATVLRKS